MAKKPGFIPEPVKWDYFETLRVLQALVHEPDRVSLGTASRCIPRALLDLYERLPPPY